MTKKHMSPSRVKAITVNMLRKRASEKAAADLAVRRAELAAKLDAITAKKGESK